MKTLQQLTFLVFVLIQSIGYSQTETTETGLDTEKFENFIGKYTLEEAGFTLEVVREKGVMYIISPFSKDILTPKNETLLQELTRGVDLELIKDDKSALKFTQNGYETFINRVITKSLARCN